MNVLVTGGSGFIGTFLVSGLLNENHNVRIFDKEMSKSFPEKVILNDMRNEAALSDSLEGVDCVYHLAAEHRDDVRPVSLYYDVNVGGAENLVRAAEKNNVNKIIFTSTVALYGLNCGIPDEESALRPFNEYGQSKLEAEKVFSEWVNGSDERSLVIVRPVVIFGEGNRGNVYNLLSQIASERFLMVGKGKNKKSMGYVRNISKFLIMLLNAGSGKHVYNYADKPDLTTIQLVRIARSALKKPTNPRLQIPYCLGLFGGYCFDLLARLTGRTFTISSIRIKKFCADTSVNADKVEKTGFVRPYSLDEGIERMIVSEFIDNN